MVDISKLKREQLGLAEKVITKDEFKEVKLLAGADQVALNDDIISSIVVCDYKTMKVVEEKYAVEKAPIPYIQGFLGYREVPAAVKAFHRLESKPDVVMFDGDGILHPRRFGAASQFGLLANVPTIGVVKKLLCGRLDGDKVVMDHEERAVQVQTREVSKPIYVSPGHMISLRTSVRIVSGCLKGHKLPEPLFLAHKYSNKVKKTIREE